MYASDEVSNFEQLYESYLHKEEIFIDEDFPPQHDIMLSNHWEISEKSSYWKDLIFVKASKIFRTDKLQVLPPKLLPSNIQQGELGNSYLLSALAVLAEVPDLLSRLFIVKDPNPSGIYCIWLCDNGEWRPVALDDVLPVREHGGKLLPAFSHSSAPELWVSLIEKAYAKIHGSYENIEGGFPEETLRDLTGAPYELIWGESDSDKVQNTISNALRQGFLVAGCTSVSENPDERLPSGLRPGHAYAILRAEDVNTVRGTESLLQIRNPWGDFEWNGDWGYESLLWSEKLKKQLGVTQREEDVFWMSAEDYLANFEATCVLKYNPNYEYYSAHLLHEEENYTILRVTVSQPSNVTFSMNQRDSRFFSGREGEEYSYSCARMLVARIEGKKGLIYVTGAHGQERNLQSSARLEPGVYLVALEIHWNQSFHRAFNFSVYTQHPVSMEGVGKADLLLIQKNIIKNIILTNPPENQQTDNYEKLGESDVVRRVGYIHGLIYYYYENDSTQLMQINEAVEVQGKNLKICSPYTDDSKFELILPPGGEELVLFKIISSSWSWKTMYSFAAEQVTEDEVLRRTSKYIYFDVPADCYPLEINDNYNKYVKKGFTVGGPKHQSQPRANQNIEKASQLQPSFSQKQSYKPQTHKLEQLKALESQLLASREMFVDNEFPPDPKKTIHHPFEEDPEWQEIKYKRLSSLYTGNDLQIISSRILPGDLQRGELGNYYFLGALGVLAENKKLIERLFIVNEPHPACIYAVWLCVNGNWTPVIIDDNIPTRSTGGQTFPAFSHSTTGEGWVALLEKAYAKVHGNYKAIESGWPEETLRDLTGAPYEVVFREQEAVKIWKTICDAKRARFILSCCTPQNPEESETNPLLPPGFAFSILDAREVASTRGTERIICVRNVWGHPGWEGDWGANSKLWTPQLKKEVGSLFGKEDCFWVFLQEYLEIFEATIVLKHNPDYFYSSVNFSLDENSTGLMRLRVHERSEITISLNQKDKRLYNHLGQDSEHQYSCGRILVGRAGKKGLTFITGAHGQDRNLHATGLFEPGDYIITVEVHWLQETDDREFNVSFYSSSDVKVEGVEKADALQIQKNIIRSMILDSPPEDQQEDDYSQVNEPNAKRIMGYAHGVLYYFYINQSSSGNRINETAMVTGKNLQICYPFHDSEQFEIEIVPNDEVLVLYKITSSAFSWKTKYSFAAQDVSDRLDPPSHRDEYVYLDNPTDRYELQVNSDYNKYLRNYPGLPDKGYITKGKGAILPEEKKPTQQMSIPFEKESDYTPLLEQEKDSLLQDLSPIGIKESATVEEEMILQNTSFQPKEKDYVIEETSLPMRKKESDQAKSSFEDEVKPETLFIQNKKPEQKVKSAFAYEREPEIQTLEKKASDEMVKSPLPYETQTQTQTQPGKKSESPSKSSARTIEVQPEVQFNKQFLNPVIEKPVPRVKAEPKKEELPIRTDPQFHYPDMEKPPKGYPPLEMKYGQTNSKKIKYINYDEINKTLELSTSHPDILNIKTPVLKVNGYKSEFIRLRFIAPKAPGRYNIILEIRANGKYVPEEILKFQIICA